MLSLGRRAVRTGEGLPFLAVALFVIVFWVQPQNISLSVLGRHGFNVRQLPCPELGDRIGNVDFGGTSGSICQRGLCKFPLKRSCFG